MTPQKTGWKLSFAMVLMGGASTVVLADETVTYTYDALGRVTVADSTGTINDGQANSWCYDRAGNRTVAKTNASGTVAVCPDPPPPAPPAPSISVDDSGAFEGGVLQFTVSLSQAYTSAVSVSFATADGTATAASGDYTAVSSTVTFAAGETSKSVQVTSLSDPTLEVTETFMLNLSSPTGGATLADGQAVGQIYNIENDPCRNNPVACF